MCDTFVALPADHPGQSVLFAKSADCEVNEANAVVRIPRAGTCPGEAVRLTHLVIPQAEETYEVLLTKAFWTYGCEIGVNEFGLCDGRGGGLHHRDGRGAGRHHRPGPDAPRAGARPDLPGGHRGDDRACWSSTGRAAAPS